MWIAENVHLGDPVITRIRRCDAGRRLVRPFNLTEGEQSVLAGSGVSDSYTPFTSVSALITEVSTVRRFKHRYVVASTKALRTEVQVV